jgi:rhodanese-related sulfurtransferase/DNA-binding transcriptional ArsR family regulator
MKTFDHRVFKDQLYEQFARITKALSSARRLELIDLLAQGERTVEALANETGMSVANVSQHLQVLRAALLIEVRRDKLYAYYRLADPQVFQLWQAIRKLGEVRLAEIDRVVETYFKDRRAFEAVSAAELIGRLDNDNILVLDVRPKIEYDAGHIPKAYSIPIDELAARLRELPETQEIVAYCRGPYCVFSDEAVVLLQAHGYRARRLLEGLPDWEAAGFPVERQRG